jgi:hypothetical protein
MKVGMPVVEMVVQHGARDRLPGPISINLERGVDAQFAVGLAVADQPAFVGEREHRALRRSGGAVAAA